MLTAVEQWSVDVFEYSQKVIKALGKIYRFYTISLQLDFNFP